jgi:N-acyl-D-amino-acid deacylase
LSANQIRRVLRGGSVVSGDGLVRADVAVEGATVNAVGAVETRDDDVVIDATGRLVLPGFVDAHSHADGLLGDMSVQHALLRQGVTTVVAGQDGVSYMPGSGAYATEYFAAINGPYAAYRGGGVAAYLASCDGTSALNAAALVPAGTVRFEVCGRDPAPATAEQRQRMAALVATGLAEGAVGLSTGLDYVPGLFQAADEIAGLCRPVARAGGVYVSHMRGGYEANAAAGIDEIMGIVDAVAAAEPDAPPLPVHVSHFHADADIVLAQLARLAAGGVDASFDAYPYTRGCSLLSMPLLPPELSVLPVDDVVAVLTDRTARPGLRAACVHRAATSPSLGPQWPTLITLAHLTAPAYAWAHGFTLLEAGRRAGVDPMDLALDALAACRLEVSAVMAVSHPRPETELARILADPRHTGGSDGIFVGAHPHPRAYGTFARYLRVLVRELGAWSWADAVHHLSARPVERFGLGRRGIVAVGAVADLVLVDPETVADTATYDDPRRIGTGIDDVLVGGVPVLADGELTPARPGRGIRRDRSGPREKES